MIDHVQDFKIPMITEEWLLEKIEDWSKTRYPDESTLWSFLTKTINEEFKIQSQSDIQELFYLEDKIRMKLWCAGSNEEILPDKEIYEWNVWKNNIFELTKANRLLDAFKSLYHQMTHRQVAEWIKQRVFIPVSPTWVEAKVNSFISKEETKPLYESLADSINEYINQTGFLQKKDKKDDRVEQSLSSTIEQNTKTNLPQKWYDEDHKIFVITTSNETTDPSYGKGNILLPDFFKGKYIKVKNNSNSELTIWGSGAYPIERRFVKIEPNESILIQSAASQELREVPLDVIQQIGDVMFYPRNTAAGRFFLSRILPILDTWKTGRITETENKG